MPQTTINLILIDDSPDDVAAVTALLAKAHYNGLPKAAFQVHATASLTRGLDRLAQTGADLILLGLSPDNEDSFRQLSAAAPGVPVVVLAQAGNEAAALEAMRAGAQDYLIKDQLSGPLVVRAIYYGLERHRLRAELREKISETLEHEKRWRILLERNVDGMVVIDQAGIIQFINPAAETLLGMAAGQGPGQPFGYPVNLSRSVELEISGGEKAPTVLEMRAVDIDWADEPAYLASLRNVTARVEAEALVDRLSRQNQLILNAAADGICGLDTAGNITFINPAAESMLKRSPADVLGQPHHAVLHYTAADGAPYSHETCPICITLTDGKERHVVDELFWRDDGTVFPVEYACTPIYEHGNLSGAVVTFKDISDRKKVEEQIVRRNRELTLVNRVIAASAASLDPSHVLQIACRELAQTFGVPQAAAALLNNTRSEAVVVAEYREGDRPSGLNEVIPVAGNPSYQFLINHKIPLEIADAQHDPLLVSVHSLMKMRGTQSILLVPLLVNNEVVGSIGLDSTELRTFTFEEINLAWSVAEQIAGVLARLNLTESQRRYSAVLEQLAESVVITDTAGEIVYVNPAFEQTTGYSRDEAMGQTPRLLKSGKHDENFYADVWKTISGGKVWHGRFINKKKDGALYTDESTISPVRNESGVITNYVAVNRDITHELDLENQYHQAQKMEAIGQLTGGVAHDFNNLLTAINGYAELLQWQIPTDDPRRQMVDQILRSGQSAADLTRHLLAFSRKQIIEPQIVDLNDVLVKAQKMLGRIIGEDISFAVNVAPELWPIKIDPAQIEQVILNLAVNARDAMPNGGQLTISTQNVELDQTFADMHFGVKPGLYACLTVADTGVGMSQAVKNRIFEPFYTTKNQGTGLGLSTVYGIITQSNGTILVDSEEGKGTSFKVYFPIAVISSAPEKHGAAFDKIPTGRETILLVEDDTNVRQLVSEVLQDLGYTLLPAVDGFDATQIAESYQGRINLLLTDVIMPGMNGKTLADLLLKTRPDLKVLFMSGYTDDIIGHHGVLDPGVLLIQKPLSPVALAYKVREALDA
jgi:PAS domain S-box-containing protein